MRVVVIASSPDLALRWPDTAHPVHLGGDLAAALTAAGHEAWLEVLPKPASEATEHAYAAVAEQADWLAERLLVLGDDGQRVLLHALDPVAGVVSAAARRGSGFPVVLRWGALPGPVGVRERRLRLAALRAADAVVAPGEVLARQARGGGAREVSVVPDGVDVAALAGPVRESADGPLLVSLSGPAPHDGGPLGLAVLRAVPEARLVVAGRSLPEAGTALVDAAERAGVADRLEWRGWVPREEALGLLSSAHVVLAPRAEGTSASAVLEAMCRARPVVAADAPGPSDVVAHRTTGLLVRPGDAAAAAAAVRSLTADPFRREACGEAGLDRVGATYAWHRVLPLLEAVYERVPAPTSSDAVADAVG